MAISYVAVGSRANTSGATSRTPALPATRSNGDLLIAICGSKNNATHSVSGTGWTKITQVNSGANWTVSLCWLIVNGSEAAPTISWTGSVASFAHVVQYSGTSSLPFGASNSNTGTTSTHSCTQITTTSPNSMVIYLDGAAANTSLATPSGWTENNDSGSATGATRDTVGSKTVANSGTGSGDISVTGANDAWVMWQYELQSPTDLTINDATNAHSTDAISLTQVHILTSADGAHSHTTDALNLTQAHILTVADGSHSHSVDSVTITEDATSSDLSVQDSAHAHAADSIILTQVHILTVAVIEHAHSTDAITITEEANLIADSGMHAHTSDAISLTQVHALNTQYGSHAHAADNITITQIHGLTVSDGLHENSVENIALVQTHIISAEDTQHEHASDGVTLTQVYYLIAADGLHAHTAENILLEVYTIETRTASARRRSLFVVAGNRSIEMNAHTRGITHAPSRTNSMSARDRSVIIEAQ